MPLTEADVLNTLSDPVALGIDFKVRSIHIKGEFFTTVRDHIRAGNILVAGGKVKENAFYDQTTDIILTQNKEPPADVNDKALLLHECVHALIDVIDHKGTITRHMGELAGYLTQITFTLRNFPTANATAGDKWQTFWADLYATVRAAKLETVAGNGAVIPEATIEKLRKQLIALPGLNYGNFKKEDKGVSDGLTRNNLFVTDYAEPISMKFTAVAYEAYPDPSDDYLIRTLLEAYSAHDVKGYGKRFRQLRWDFLHCSASRALNLHQRLMLRKKGDRVSELFHDRLSKGGRNILLRVLSFRK